MFAPNGDPLIWFYYLFLPISSLSEVPKIGLWKLFCKWKFLRNEHEQLHLFAKDEKGYPFLSIGSCSDKTETGTLFFLSILLSLKTIGKGVKQTWYWQKGRKKGRKKGYPFFKKR